MCAHQQALVRRVGLACRRLGRPFVLEILPYPLPGEPDPPLGALERAVAAFAQPEFGVDLYKLPYPGGRFQAYRSLPAPWVLLSGRLGFADFMRALEASLEGGAVGFLAGRAFWLEAVRRYPDMAAMERELERAQERFLLARGLLGVTGL
ncbi:Tagatose 1,6-diphosphate aldolase 2 [Meiothermus luteus]|uniref:Tagatose 1,6-diphosphate aldolase 2 n=1 Tax=Meiothermus luteus TaxID=2026184 RepID=A0A399EAR1_9DEIN|nr:Tagatose 1,6-diphosphate aldolase 2 [Meiothermus luteus]